MCIFLLILSKDSPLFDLNSTDLAKEKFELIVIMEGTIETSSMTFQARYVMMNIIMIIITIMTIETRSMTFQALFLSLLKA